MLLELFDYTLNDYEGSKELLDSLKAVKTGETRTTVAGLIL